MVATLGCTASWTSSVSQTASACGSRGPWGERTLESWWLVEPRT
jgi:hypothetical protein